MPSGPDEPISSLHLGKGWFSDEPGGLNRYVRNLLEALPASRAVVVGAGNDAPASVTAVSGPEQPLFQRLRRYAAAAAAGDRPDVVDSHFALYSFAPVLLGGLRRRPLVVHFHGPWAAESLATGDSRVVALLKRAVERAVYRRACEAVVLSQAFKRILVESYGVSPWRVSVVHPGVDLAHFVPGHSGEARARLGLRSDAWVAFSPRRLVPRMGLDVLLDAWATARIPRGRLLIAGDGPFGAELEHRTAELGIADSVRFLGRIDDSELVSCYRAADVCVVPSTRLEGFGLVVLEALACGTPVVVSDAGGLLAAVTGLDAGLVVPAGDSAALACRLSTAATGAEPLPGADRCRAHAERFTWRRAAERHVEIYRRATRSARRRPLRVVYLDHTAQLSGGELALLRLLPALDRVDAHVILAADGPLVARLLAADISAEVLPLAHGARERSRHTVGPASLVSKDALSASLYALRLARRLRRLRPDLVHTNSLKAAFYGGLAGRLAGVPVVCHVRDRIAGDYLPPGAVGMVRTSLERLVTAVIANSQATLDTLQTRRPAFVVPSPVDISQARALGRRNGGPLQVGILGRIAPWKGQDLFLRAFATAFRSGDERAYVIGAPLFRGDEAFVEELERLAGELGVDGRVTFTGFRHDVHSALADLDVLVHASTTPEPFGQAVVEGMAAGLPVVAADAGGPAEIIADGESGLLYPPGDVDALVAALERLARDAALRAALGEKARQVVAGYSPEEVARRTLDVYDDLMRMTGARSEP
jgi:glycosyltransferase involved in cell wall biosynthesis